MLWKMCRQGGIGGMGVVGCWLIFVAIATAGNRREPEMPKFSDVQKTVIEYFDKLPGYKSGEILSQGLVKPVFRSLEQIGWKVTGQKKIVEDVLPDNDSLVKELRSPAGKKFARQIATVSQGYDYLDRLRRLPRGRENVENLIRGPDGYLMIKYMTIKPYGKNLGKMLSQDPGGKNFNKPTGRIYTVDELIERLRQEYEKETGQKVAPKSTSGKRGGRGKKSTGR